MGLGAQPFASGLELLCHTYPALKRWASLGRPYRAYVVFSITCVDYSSGSTAFGVIAPDSGASYNRSTLVLDSSAGLRVG
jgi:hypothetical protein